MSALKQVLNRRLFRQNGMLGPENPQGILNSSNELANTVRMQDGGYLRYGDAHAPIYGPGNFGISLGKQPMGLEEAQGLGLVGDRGAPVIQENYMGPSDRAVPIDASTPQDIRPLSQLLVQQGTRGTPSGEAIPRRSVQTPLRDTSISELAAETPESLADAMFPDRGPEYRRLWEGSTRGERWGNLLDALGENLGTGASELAFATHNLGQDISEYFTGEELGGTIPFELGATINEMQRDQPELAAEIESAAVRVIAQSRRGHQEGVGPRNPEHGGFDETVFVPGRDPSSEELRQQVATILYNTVERPSIDPTVAERIEAERMQLRPTVDPTNLISYEDSSKLHPAEYKTPPVTGGEGDVTPPVTGGEGDVTSSVTGGEGDVTSSVPDDITAPRISDQTNLGKPDMGQGTDAGTVIDTVAEVLADPDQPIENKKKTINEYKQEFIDALPEYEGKTQFEKGMDWAKFGAAIMAGRSQHAIQNIGDAFLAMGDEFTEDAEGKRAFEQAIELSSAKYSLAQINKDLDREREDERAFQYYFDPEDPTKMKIMTTADLLAGRLPPSNMVPKDVLNAMLTLQGVKEKATQGLLDKANLTEPERKRYTEGFKDASAAVTRATTGKRLLKGVMDGIARKGGASVVGGLGAVSQFSDMVQNVFNIKKTDYELNKEGDLTPVSREAILADIRKAFQLLIPITVGASQSANSISDRDVSILSRAVVANILNDDKAVSDLLAGSEDVLFAKIQYSYNLFSGSLEAATTTMDSLDRQFQDKLDHIYGDKGVVTRRAGVLVDPYRPKPQPTPTSGQVIKWQDFVDTPRWQEYSGRVAYDPAQYEDEVGFSFDPTTTSAPTTENTDEGALKQISSFFGP